MSDARWYVTPSPMELWEQARRELSDELPGSATRAMRYRDLMIEHGLLLRGGTVNPADMSSDEEPEAVKRLETESGKPLFVPKIYCPTCYGVGCDNCNGFPMVVS